MGCPYLESKGVRRVCGASVFHLTPESDEAENYCTTEEHYRCPILLAHVLRGGRGSGSEFRV